MSTLDDLLVLMRERGATTAPTLSERPVFDEPSGVVIVPFTLCHAARASVGQMHQRWIMADPLPKPTTYRNKRRRGKVRRRNRDPRRRFNVCSFVAPFTVNGEEQ